MICFLPLAPGNGYRLLHAHAVSWCSPVCSAVQDTWIRWAPTHCSQSIRLRNKQITDVTTFNLIRVSRDGFVQKLSEPVVSCHMFNFS
ncbi:hypothetical protein EMCRGX_G019355 [Ephydatia muelleri]